MSLLLSIREFLGHTTAERPGIVVAVSGGADSVALLRALIELNAPGPLIVAHLNHQLRGDDSAGDEQFVRELGASVNLPVHIECRDVAALARDACENLEAAARRERYRFLAAIARESGVGRIATGHTANDQAETVLHRLLRGTGLQGLRGIARERELEPGLRVVRPMLNATRAEVLDYLRRLGQSFRDDRSNADLRFTRNRIRHELLPLLETAYNPAIVSLLGRLAEQASDQFADVSQDARELLQRCELPPAGALRVLDAATLTAAPRNLRREALRQLLQREGWPRDRMRFADWDRVAAVAAGEMTAADLPGRVHVRRRGRVVQIGPEGSVNPHAV